jgi:uncharacterized membrane protein YfcA
MFESRAIRDTVAIVSLSALGLLAGMMLGIFVAGYAARGLPEESWTRRFQVENRLFTKTMPPSLMLPLLGLIASVPLTRDTARSLFAVAAVLTAIVLVITIALEVPINRQVASWTAGAAPANWTGVRDRWLWNHLARTVVGVLAFLCAATALSELYADGA